MTTAGRGTDITRRGDTTTGTGIMTTAGRGTDITRTGGETTATTTIGRDTRVGVTQPRPRPATARDPGQGPPVPTRGTLAAGESTGPGPGSTRGDTETSPSLHLTNNNIIVYIV